jgi:hypothetical protein
MPICRSRFLSKEKVTMKWRTLAAALAAVFVSAAAHAATMQCQPYQQVTGGAYPGTGSPGYTADLDGIVTGVAANDTDALVKAGCSVVGQSGYTLLGRIVGANMNVTMDQKVSAAQWFVGANQGWVPGEMVAKDCSVSLTTAAGAVYDAASKGGNRIYGSGTTQAYSGCTGANTGQHVAALTGSAIVEAGSTLPVLSLTTAQGAAATATIYFYGYVLGQ